MFKACLFFNIRHKILKQCSRMLTNVTNIILDFCIVLNYLQNYSVIQFYFIIV